MNESRLLGFLGDGGCEPAVEGDVLRVLRVPRPRVAEGEGDSGDNGEMAVEIGVGSVCKGCS